MKKDFFGKTSCVVGLLGGVLLKGSIDKVNPLWELLDEIK